MIPLDMGNNSVLIHAVLFWPSPKIDKTISCMGPFHLICLICDASTDIVQVFYVKNERERGKRQTKNRVMRFIFLLFFYDKLWILTIDVHVLYPNTGSSYSC